MAVVLEAVCVAIVDVVVFVVRGCVVIVVVLNVAIAVAVCVSVVVVVASDRRFCSGGSGYLGGSFKRYSGRVRIFVWQCLGCRVRAFRELV